MCHCSGGSDHLPGFRPDSSNEARTSTYWLMVRVALFVAKITFQPIWSICSKIRFRSPIASDTRHSTPSISRMRPEIDCLVMPEIVNVWSSCFLMLRKKLGCTRRTDISTKPVPSTPRQISIHRSTFKRVVPIGLFFFDNFFRGALEDFVYYSVVNRSLGIHIKVSVGIFLDRFRSLAGVESQNLIQTGFQSQDFTRPRSRYRSPDPVHHPEVGVYGWWHVAARSADLLCQLSRGLYRRKPSLPPQRC